MAPGRWVWRTVPFRMCLVAALLVVSAAQPSAADAQGPYYVAIGEGEGLAPEHLAMVRGRLERRLDRTGEITVAPRGETPAQAEEVLHAGHLVARRVDFHVRAVPCPEGFWLEVRITITEYPDTSRRPSVVVIPLGTRAPRIEDLLDEALSVMLRAIVPALH